MKMTEHGTILKVLRVLLAMKQIAHRPGCSNCQMQVLVVCTADVTIVVCRYCRCEYEDPHHIY